MKYILLLLLPCLLQASNLQLTNTISYYSNEIDGIFTSPDGTYDIFDFDPDYSSTEMVDVFHYVQSKKFVDPSQELQGLGCDQKIHITDDGRIYCTDQANQYLLRISVDSPFSVLESFYLGFPNTNFYNWLNTEPQYITYVGIMEGDAMNFTNFNTSNNEFITSLIADPVKLTGSDMVIEGYCITPDYMGWTFYNETTTQLWKATFADQQTTLIAEFNLTNPQRTIILNFNNYIFLHGDTLYTTDVTTGQTSTLSLNTTISDINKINHTHFVAAAGNQLSLITIDENNKFIQAAFVDLSSYLQITDAVISPPDCCSDLGFLQAWVTKPQQDSYFLLVPDTLEVGDYETPFQFDNATAPNFSPFLLGNFSLISPTYDGYRVQDSMGEYAGFVSVPLQDVYYDPSNDDFVYGFYSGATMDYPKVNTCYLLVIQKSQSSFTTVNFPQCPNPTKKSSLSLLDVQCDSNLKCNITYQISNSIYVITDEIPYIINSKLAQSSTIGFTYYDLSKVILITVIPDAGSSMGQVIMEGFDFETSEQYETKILSVYGTAAKIQADAVLYSYSNLLETTVSARNLTTGSNIFNTTVSEARVSDLIPLNLGSTFVTLTPAGITNLYELNGQALSVTAIDYNSMGSVAIQQTGKSTFVLTTYDNAMQSSLLYTLSSEALIVS